MVSKKKVHLNFILFSLVLCSLLKLNHAQPGPKGEKGEKGVIGDTGPTIDGNVGDKGERGVTGLTGAPGDKGLGFSYNGFRQCALGWSLFDGHCYLVGQNPIVSLDYNSARASCQSFSTQITGFPADLASIDYGNEFTFINNLIGSVNPGLNTFIGLTETAAGVFTWTDATSSIDPAWWCPGAPGAALTANNPISCGEITTGCIHNVDCTVSTAGQAFVCEYELFTLESKYTVKGQKGLQSTDQGDPGDVGQTGDQGPIGNQGPIGPDGATGNKGPQGDPGDNPIGNKGEQGVTGGIGDDGNPGIQGEKGSSVKGEAGDKGVTGDQGANGDQGIKGVAGDQGPPADKGDVGFTGVKGAQGDKGDKGIYASLSARHTRRLETAESQAQELKDKNVVQDTKIDQSLELHKNFNVETFNFLNALARLINQKFGITTGNGK